MLTADVKMERLKKMMVKMAKAGKSMKPLMTRFYGEVNKQVMLNFRLQSAPPDIFTKEPGDSRKPWEPISSYTAKSRLMSRKSTTQVGGALQASGKMYASMGKVREITHTKMVYGTPSWLSEVHHFGKTIRPKRTKYLALPYPGVTGRPRQYKKTWVRGKTIYRKNPETGETQRLFFLKDHVDIPARPHITVPAKTLSWFLDATWMFYISEADDA